MYLNSGVVGVCYTRVNWRGGGTSDLALSAFWCSRVMKHWSQLDRVHLTNIYLHFSVVGLGTI